MELTEALAFAADRHQGILATLKADGRPQLTNIIFQLDGDTARISTGSTRAKAANLRRDARASLHVGGDDFWHWVVLDGTTELSAVAEAPGDDTVEELVALYRQLSGEHPDWDEYRRAMVTERRVALRFTATHAYGQVP